MNFFLFYQKKRRNVSSFFFLGHSSGHLGADGKKRWDVFSAHRGQRRQAAFCAGQATLPEAGALPEGVFSPGDGPFGEGLCVDFLGRPRPFAAIALVLCPRPARNRRHPAGSRPGFGRSRRRWADVSPLCFPPSGRRAAAFDTAPSFAYNANCSILTISRAV